MREKLFAGGSVKMLRSAPREAGMAPYDDSTLNEDDYVSTILHYSIDYIAPWHCAKS